MNKQLIAIDRRTHNPCPNKPEGYKWWAHNSGRFGSCGFGFDTFAEALAYCRQGWQRALKDTKARRHIGDEHSTSEFRCSLEGPYGEFDCTEVYRLVTGRDW